MYQRKEKDIVQCNLAHFKMFSEKILKEYLMI